MYSQTRKGKITLENQLTALYKMDQNENLKNYLYFLKTIENENLSYKNIWYIASVILKEKLIERQADIRKQKRALSRLEKNSENTEQTEGRNKTQNKNENLKNQINKSRYDYLKENKD